jgi:hypothetical protein
MKDAYLSFMSTILNNISKVSSVKSIATSHSNSCYLEVSSIGSFCSRIIILYSQQSININYLNTIIIDIQSLFSLLPSLMQRYLCSFNDNFHI